MTDPIAPRPYILDLPVEVKQHIGGFCGAQDLTELRLTCKELAAAMFDLFANEYLETLYCFVLNPARVRRIHELASRPHLMRKIKAVELCLDPYEGDDTGPRDDATDDIYICSRYERFSRPPNERLLNEVFHLLSEADCLGLRVNLNCFITQDDDFTKVEENIEAITNSILQATTGASVQSLVMDGIACQSDALINALKSWPRSLQHVCFGTPQGEASSEQISDATALEQAWQDVFLALRACECLEQFAAENLRVIDEAGDEYRYIFYEHSDPRRSESVSVEGRDEVTELLDITIQKGVRVEDD